MLSGLLTEAWPLQSPLGAVLWLHAGVRCSCTMRSSFCGMSVLYLAACAFDEPTC